MLINKLISLLIFVSSKGTTGISTLVEPAGIVTEASGAAHVTPSAAVASVDVIV
jgi:hypothetical protein